MMINILIVNWNSSEALASCLASIVASEFDSYRVIVIDNGSDAQNLLGLETLESLYKNEPVVFLHDKENRGYAGGNNTGLEYLRRHNLDGDILIVNPDVQLRPETLQVMAAAAVGDVGIVVPRIVDPQGKVLWDRIRLSGFHQKNIINSEPTQAPADIAQGTCLLIRRSVVEAIGLFDERFFLYWEEVDFSLRARESGFRIVAVNTTSVVKGHNEPARIPPCFYYSVRNANLIRKIHPEHFSLSGYTLYTIRIAILCFKLIGNIHLFSEAWVAVAQGLRDGISGQYGARKAA